MHNGGTFQIRVLFSGLIPSTFGGKGHKIGSHKSTHTHEHTHTHTHSRTHDPPHTHTQTPLSLSLSISLYPSLFRSHSSAAIPFARQIRGDNWSSLNSSGVRQPFSLIVFV